MPRKVINRGHCGKIFVPRFYDKREIHDKLDNDILHTIDLTKDLSWIFTYHQYNLELSIYVDGKIKCIINNVYTVDNMIEIYGVEHNYYSNKCPFYFGKFAKRYPVYTVEYSRESKLLKFKYLDKIIFSCIACLSISIKYSKELGFRMICHEHKNLWMNLVKYRNLWLQKRASIKEFNLITLLCSSPLWLFKYVHDISQAWCF